MEGELANFVQNCIPADIKSGRIFDKEGKWVQEGTCGGDERV